MKDMHLKTVLSVEALCKSFHNVQAVNDLTFSLDRGDIFAFLGPNGAGKTTTLRMLLDIIRPDTGRINWNLNGNQGRFPSAEQIGYLPEERGLYTDIPVIRSLVYLASIRGMEPSKARKAAMEWLERFSLADRAKEKLQALSKGNQQKIQFISSVLHQPAFIILDEPFSGLDPLNQEIFIDCIREINESGSTILLSAHQMSLVEKIAGKVFLINNGKEVYNGTLSGIYDSFGRKHIIDIHFDSAVDVTVFQTLEGVEKATQVDGCQVTLTIGQATDLNLPLAELAGMRGICDITTHKPDLHEIFLQLVKSHRP